MNFSKNAFDRVSLPLTCMTALLLSWQGMHVGLPQAEVVGLSFSDSQQFNTAKKAFLSTREEVYAHYGVIAAHNPGILAHSFKTDLKKVMILDMPEGPQEVPVEIIHKMRGRFLRSALPDEELLIYSLQKIRPAKFQFNPHLFQYGSIYIYFAGFLLWLCAKIGLVILTQDISVYLNNPDYSAMIYAVPKYANSVIFALSVWPLHRVCRRLFRPAVASVLALSYAVSPIFILETHSLKPYIFCLPALLMSLDSAFVIASGDRRAYAAAGAWAGLATGSLWLCGYILIAIFAAHCIAPRRRTRDLAVLSAVFAAVFFLVNPYWLIAPREAFAELFLLQPVVAHAYSLKKWVGYLLYRGAAGLGWPLWLCFLAGLLTSLASPDKRKYILLCPVLFYLTYTSGRHFGNVHYATALFPLCLVVAGFAIEALWNVRSPWTHLRLALVPVVICMTLLQSLYFVSLCRAPDPAYTAGAWINRHVPAHSFVAANSPGMFPPFRCLDYRPKIIDSISDVKSGDYYIRSGDLHDVLPNLGADFIPLASFQRKSVLGALFDAREVFWLNYKYEIFRKV
ncbi:MAG: hypothetical protein A2X37_12475 [Elusimicrobia bacterium GWA2_66_18]|nr:MAG: hypothetical protein A2X37_12475 [Elusimicrobia bacterium GWA2_66_18]